MRVYSFGYVRRKKRDKLKVQRDIYVITFKGNYSEILKSTIRKKYFITESHESINEISKFWVVPVVKKDLTK